MADSLNDIAGSGFTFCTDHGCTLTDAPQSFSQILCTADKRHLKSGFINMINVICRSQHLAFVDIVDFNGFQNLRFHKVANPAFCHNGNSHGLLNTADHFRITHTGNTTGSTDICRDTFQGHDGAGACILSDPGLLRSGNVHNDAAL